jgi:hypothetical protein
MGWGDCWTCNGARVGVSESRGCIIVISCVMRLMSMQLSIYLLMRTAHNHRGPSGAPMGAPFFDLVAFVVRYRIRN